MLNKLVTNLKTLEKYNLFSADSVRSACAFAFVAEEAPLSEKDYMILQYFSEHPLATYLEVAEGTGIVSQTASAGLLRLKNRNGIRIAGIMDPSAFGIQRYTVFFTLRDNADWSNVEDSLASFPFIKSILKTITSDIGYLVFAIPGYEKNSRIFERSLQSLKGTVFDYLSIHRETWSGANTNLSLLQDRVWFFPEQLISDLDKKESSPLVPKCLIQCNGPVKSFTQNDFLIATELVLDARLQAVDIDRRLTRQGYELGRNLINRSIKRLLESNIVSPHVRLMGVGLSANICIEIICNESIINEIASAYCHAPSLYFFASPRGIILWLMVPSSQQVQYIQLLQLLEEKQGVKSIRPILTIQQKGSRGILDLVSSCKYREDGWWAPKQEVDISRYF
jgi:hypothetical protein